MEDVKTPAKRDGVARKNYTVYMTERQAKSQKLFIKCHNLWMKDRMERGLTPEPDGLATDEDQPRPRD